MVQCFPFFSPLKGRKRAQAPAAKQAESQGPKELKTPLTSDLAVL